MTTFAETPCKKGRFSFYPLCVPSELFLVKHGEKSNVRTVCNSQDFSFSKLSLLLIFDNILPEIIQIEHTKDKKKTCSPFNTFITGKKSQKCVILG